MKRMIIAVSLLLVVVGFSTGCDKRSDQSVAAAGQPQSQTEQAIPQPVARIQPQLFIFRGVHAGMTVAEVKTVVAPHVRTQFLCGNVYGGPHNVDPIVACSFDIANQELVYANFYQGRLFTIDWECPDDPSWTDCTKAKALLNAHFGKPEDTWLNSDRDPGMPRDYMWRSPQETAIVCGSVYPELPVRNFTVMNYEFAPTDQPKHRNLRGLCMLG
jgi:hypothetical protein